LARDIIFCGAALVALAATVGCSSNEAAASPLGGADAASDAAYNLNPDGIPYPSPPGGYGRMARSGTTPGSVIANYKFQGYPNGNESGGLQTIALADYYDPCGKRSKLLHLSVAGVWCVGCSDETVAIVAGKADLASKGVVVIQALSDGPTEGVAATPSDLDYWVAKFMSNFTEMLDPGLMNLGGFFPAETLPWNCDIDPRTMEILDDSTGWAGDLDTEIQPGLTAMPAVPSYPIPAACGDE
jgi:hypothetical protein